MIKLEKKETGMLFQVEGNEPELMYEVMFIAEKIYNSLSSAGQKTMKESWNTMFAPYLTESEKIEVEIARMKKEEGMDVTDLFSKVMTKGDISKRMNNLRNRARKIMED